MHHLIGTAEIADMLGVSRQRVYQITSRPDFPQPVARLAIRVWDAEQVTAWIAEHRPSYPDEP